MLHVYAMKIKKSITSLLFYVRCHLSNDSKDNEIQITLLDFIIVFICFHKSLKYLKNIGQGGNQGIVFCQSVM